jgi:hypothetical protein
MALQDPRATTPQVHQDLRVLPTQDSGDKGPYRVGRAKAWSFSGCKSRPAAFVPAGSNRSRRGGNETAEASGVEGHESDSASMQAVT